MSGPRWEPAPQPGTPWSRPDPAAQPDPPSGPATEQVPATPPTELVPTVPAWTPPAAPPPPLPPTPASPLPPGPPVAPGPGDGTPPPGSPDAAAKRRRLVIVASVLGTVALLLIAALVVGATRGDDDPAPSTSTSVPERTTTSLEVLSGDVDLGSGVVARVPAGSLTAGATLRAEPVPFPADDLGPAMASAGPFLSIRVVGGEQLGPITLIFPIDDPAAATPPGETDPVLFGVHARPGGVETVAGTYDAGAQTFSVEARSLATWGPARWVWDRVDETLAAASAAYHDAGSLDPTSPTCAGPDRSDVVDVDDPDGVLRWCAEGEEDGARTIRLLDGARHAVVLTAPPEASVEPGPSGSSQELVRWIDDAPGEGQTVLTSTQGAVVTVPSDVDAELTVSYGGVAHQVTSLRAGIDAVLALRAAVPFAGSGDPVAVERSIDPAACLGAPSDGGRVDIGVLGAVVAGCFDGGVLEGAVGRGLVPALAPLLQTEAMADALAERAQEGVERTGADVTIVVEAAPEPPGPGELWPTGDLEGTPEYAAWLAVRLTLPDWTSCGDAVCLAGTGDSVLVTSLDPLEDLGTIPFDVEDPVAALVELGVSKAEARRALEPG